MLARIIARHSAGSLPPCGATPMSSALGRSASPSSHRRDDGDVTAEAEDLLRRRARRARESITPTTRSGV